VKAVQEKTYLQYGKESTSKIGADGDFGSEMVCGFGEKGFPAEIMRVPKPSCKRFQLRIIHPRQKDYTIGDK